MRARSSFVVRLLLAAVTAAGCTGHRSVPSSGQVAPGVPQDQVFQPADAASQRTFRAAMAVGSEKAMASFPSVLKRFHRGLPAEQRLFVVTRLKDASGRREQVFVGVDSARSPAEGRVSLAAGIEGGGGLVAQGRFLQAGYRVARAGPVAIELSASRSQAHQWRRFEKVSTLEYCPGCPPPDTANAFVDWRAGVVFRFDRMPRFLNRLVPFGGFGTYHAPWLGLPARDAHRPPLWTGYKLGGLDLRVTRKPRLSLGLTLTQLRNVRNRDDKTDARLAIRWDTR
jgi:hypothetical protein